jgi:serine/threonine protein kinase
VTRLPAPERWRKIAPLLQEALEIPPQDRGAYLERACGGDASLRTEIEELLGADSEAGGFLDVPVDLSSLEGTDPESGSTPDPGVPEGTTIGSYLLIREIGRGGMGVVYEAEQQRPKRAVALKVILGGRHVDPETIRMFRRETESLARLKHPSIAAIYESSTTDDGRHFFAMELVPGRPLSDYLEERGPPASRHELRHRLLLFRKVAAGVAYAHQRGVIHRDLKPSNILVIDPANGDSVPEVKVLDFGLARITDPDADAENAGTAVGRIQGTLPYMSPEQVSGRRDEVDVRTDVYALGVILYRMTTGRLPYDLEGLALPEAARIICERAPQPVAAAAEGRVRFDHDLTVIVLKALEKAPARRYQGVTALDEDLGRYLAAQPILARPPSAAYLLRKLIARHKVSFAAAVMLVVLLAAFAAVMTLQARRIAAERDRANREAMTAGSVSQFVTRLFKVSNPSEARGNAVTAREILDEGAAKLGRELAGEPEVQSRLMLTMGVVYSSLGLYGKAVPLLERSVDIRRRLLGSEHPDTLASLSALAGAYSLQGRIPEADAIFPRVLEAQTRLLGEAHDDTRATMTGLAGLYRYKGRYQDEERLRQRLLDLRRASLGEDDPETLKCASDLASTYWVERRYPEAESLYEPTLERERRVLGDDHPTTLGAMHTLANVEYNLRRNAESEKLFREVLDRERRVLGEDHPETLASMNDFATMLDVQGRNAEAEAIYRDVLARRRRVLGEDHQSTLTSMTNLANILSAEGHYADAIALLAQALERERRLLGEDHPETYNTLYNLGCVAALSGDRAGALQWLGQAVSHGWTRADEMSKDEDLKSLHGDRAFDALVARAGQGSVK